MPERASQKTARSKPPVKLHAEEYMDFQKKNLRLFEIKLQR